MITLQSTNSPSFKSTLNEVRCRFRTHKPVHPLTATSARSIVSHRHETHYNSTSHFLEIDQPKLKATFRQQWTNLRPEENSCVWVFCSRNHVHRKKNQKVENSSGRVLCEHSINSISGSFSFKNLTLNAWCKTDSQYHLLGDQAVQNKIK